MSNKPLVEQLKDVKAFFFDMDGIFTDGSVTVMPDGELIRTMYVRDGFALKTICSLGFKTAIISAGFSQGAIKRFEGFGVNHVVMSSGKKINDFNTICEKEGLLPDDVLYMGDDVADLECLRIAGISVCPNDACVDVLPAVDYVTKENGGRGAVREIVEMVLRAQNKWNF